MFDKILNKYSLVVLDLNTKLFFILFTYLTTLYLSKEDFNEFAYYRTTLMMMVGLSVTGLGFFILNYFNEVKDNFIELKKLNSVSLFIILLASICIFFVLFFFRDLLHLSNIFNAIDFFTLYILIVFAILFQISIYYIKVLNCFKDIAKYYLGFFIIFVGLTFYLLSKYEINGAVLDLLLLYLILSTSFIFIVLKKLNKMYKNYSSYFTINIFDNKFKSFLIPNILESFLSVPRTWLSMFIFIQLLSFNGVGDLILLQMILGMFIFFIQSLLMNEYTQIDLKIKKNRYTKIKKIKKIINISIVILIVIINIFWIQLQEILNITELSNEFILLLYIGTIIQAQLMIIGMVFKKTNYSKLTFYHNLFYAISFLLIEYILILNFGQIGYSIAFLTAWLLTYSYMAYHLNKFELLSIKSIFVESIFFIFISVILYFIRFY
jgi:O-antigen/teichoic acid export membrane protein